MPIIIPVSIMGHLKDGHIDMGLTAYEKRGLAVHVPVWDPDKCSQCNRCSFVCPHAVIRPFLLNEKEAENAPEGTPESVSGEFPGEPPEGDQT